MNDGFIFFVKLWMGCSANVYLNQILLPSLYSAPSLSNLMNHVECFECLDFTSGLQQSQKLPRWLTPSSGSEWHLWTEEFFLFFILYFCSEDPLKLKSPFQWVPAMILSNTDKGKWMVFVSRVNWKHARQATVPLDLYSAKIRSFVSFQDVPNLNPASVSSRLDYCTCLFLGLVQRSIESHLWTFAIFWLFFATLFMFAKLIFMPVWRHRLGWQTSVYYQGSSDL